MQYRLQIYTMSEKDLLLTIAKMNVFKKKLCSNQDWLYCIRNEIYYNLIIILNSKTQNIKTLHVIIKCNTIYSIACVIIGNDVHKYEIDFK